MDKLKVEYTHKGWFLFCPIWIADWESGTPAVAPRYKLEPLFWLADQFFYFMSAMHEMKTGEPLPLSQTAKKTCRSLLQGRLKKGRSIKPDPLYFFINFAAD